MRASKRKWFDKNPGYFNDWTRKDFKKNPWRYVLRGAKLRAKKEGVPFDWFEKHSDVGGIWDMNNPGTPMYDSAHFISSKYTSGFYGYPMPADYPDYPSWKQILDYIRNFADKFDLKRRVNFGVSVTEATPIENQQWKDRKSVV